MKKAVIFSFVVFFSLFIHRICFLSGQPLSPSVKIILTVIVDTNEKLIKDPLNEHLYIKKRMLESEVRDIIANNQLADLAVSQIRRIDKEKLMYKELIYDLKENQMARQRFMELINFLSARNEEYLRLVSKFK
jgi:hypothetical protein